MRFTLLALLAAIAVITSSSQNALAAKTKRHSKPAPAATSEYDRRLQVGAAAEDAKERAEEAARPKVDPCAPKRSQMTEAIARSLGVTGDDVMQYYCGVHHKKVNNNSFTEEFATNDLSYVCREGEEMGMAWVTCVDSSGNERQVIETQDVEKLPHTWE